MIPQAKDARMSTLTLLRKRLGVRGLGRVGLVRVGRCQTQPEQACGHWPGGRPGWAYARAYVRAQCGQAAGGTRVMFKTINGNVEG